MQSNDNPPEDTPPSEVGVTPTPTLKPTPLRREAILIASERHRGALIAAFCSLAGVGLGFGLSQMAAANDSCRRAVQVEHVQTRRVASVDVTPRMLAVPVPQFTWLGVTGHTAKSSCGHSNLQRGAQVTGVFPGSPAEAAGLEVGDLITGVEGTPVMGFPQLAEVVRARDEGERVIIEYVDSSKQPQRTQATLVKVDRSKLRRK